VKYDLNLNQNLEEILREYQSIYHKKKRRKIQYSLLQFDQAGQKRQNWLKLRNSLTKMNLFLVDKGAQRVEKAEFESMMLCNIFHKKSSKVKK